MAHELEERYILEWFECTGKTSYTLITEYFMDGEWKVVHTECAIDGIKEILDRECESVESSNYRGLVKKVIYKPKKTNDGIWFRNRVNNVTGKFSPLVEEDMKDKYDPVFVSLAEAHFYVDEMGEIVEKPELTESLYRVEEDVMYFNFNWIPEENNPTPLKTLLEIMDKIINVEILFHDKEEKTIYVVKLKNFKFLKIHSLRHYDWSYNGIKELPVEYTFEQEQIIV